MAGGLTGGLAKLGPVFGKLGPLFSKLGAPFAKLGPLLSRVLGPLSGLKDRLSPAVNQLEEQFHQVAGQVMDEVEDHVHLPPAVEHMVEHTPEKRRTALMAGLGVLGVGFLIGLGIWLLSVSSDKEGPQTAGNTPALSLPMPPRSGLGGQALLNPPPVSGQEAGSPLQPPRDDVPPTETPPTSQQPLVAEPGPAPPPPIGGSPAPAITPGEAGPPPSAEPSLAKSGSASLQAPSLREGGEGGKLSSLSPVAGQPALPTNSGQLSIPKFTDIPKPQTAPQPVPMPEAPQSALLRKTGAGAVPTIAPDGREPWKTYARPFDPADKRPRIAVVVYDLGLQKEAAEAAIQLMPPDITLSFSPYAVKVDDLVKRAHEAGHETLLDLPLDSNAFPYRDPGPLGLISSLSSAENLRRLEVLLSKAQGYNGLAAIDGQRFLSNRQQVDELFRELKKDGLLFVDNGLAGNQVALMNAESLELPYVKANIMIDDRHFRSAIDIRLRKAEDDAQAKGRALVLIPAKPLAMDRVAAWIKDLSTRGIALAPVSAVVTGGKTDQEKGAGHE